LQSLAKQRYLQCVLRPVLDNVLEHAFREACLGARQLRLDTRLSGLVRADWHELRRRLVDQAGAASVRMDQDGTVVVVLFEEPPRAAPCGALAVGFYAAARRGLVAIAACFATYALYRRWSDRPLGLAAPAGCPA
jgi:hypothetical protein